jgi:hypothetical protein
MTERAPHKGRTRTACQSIAKMSSPEMYLLQPNFNPKTDSGSTPVREPT